MSKRMSQPPSPAATIVTTLPHYPRSRSVLPRSFTSVRRFSRQASRSRRPRKAWETSSLPFYFLQRVYALSRSTASNKMLRSNRRGHGGVPLASVLEAHHSELCDVVAGRGAKGAARQSRVRPLHNPLATRMITSLQLSHVRPGLFT